MKSISLKIPDEIHSLLAQASAQQGTAKSEIIRKALAAYFSNSKNQTASCADLAGDLIGSLEGPSDLAVNPEHMKGYGRGVVQ